MMDDATIPGRKLLKQEGDVQMWQEYIDGPHRDTGQLLRYFVGRPTSPPKSFDAPHHAWDYFRKLTGAPASRPDAAPAPKRRPDRER
jgi:hypothetical protein